MKSRFQVLYKKPVPNNFTLYWSRYSSGLEVYSSGQHKAESNIDDLLWNLWNLSKQPHAEQLKTAAFGHLEAFCEINIFEIENSS